MFIAIVPPRPNHSGSRQSNARPLKSFQSSRRELVQEHLIELCVGETLQVGCYRVTLLQVNGDELSIEVDGDGEFDLEEIAEALQVC